MFFLFSFILRILIFFFGNFLLQHLKITIIVIVFRFTHKKLLSMVLNINIFRQQEIQITKICYFYFSILLLIL